MGGTPPTEKCGEYGSGLDMSGTRKQRKVRKKCKEGDHLYKKYRAVPILRSGTGGMPVDAV